MPPLLTIGSEHLTPILVPCFVRDGFVEDDTLVSFFNKLNDVKLGDSPHDIVRWDLDFEGDFTVKSYYLKLLHLNLPCLHDLFGGFPHELIWRSMAPLKVSVFVWEDFD